MFESCPGNQTQITSPGQPTAVVAWQGPSATDNSGKVPLVHCHPVSGSHLTIGWTVVTCLAVDDSGNEEACSFHVHIIGKFCSRNEKKMKKRENHFRTKGN